MPRKGACAVVFDESRNQVLLQQRSDFRIWGLPGGRIEPGEAWEEAAIRETYEETGYHIAVDRLVGEYWRPQALLGVNLSYVGLGRVTGGKPIERGPETLAVQWFPLDALPSRMTPFHREYIQDATADAPDPIQRTLRMPTVQALVWRILVWQRDLRNRLTGRP